MVGATENVLTSPSVMPNEILYTTNDRDDYENKLHSLRQQKYMNWVWQKAKVGNAMQNLNGYTAVRLMYRDADLMDGTCEIGTALDIISEEACLAGNTQIKLLNGKILTIKELFDSNVKDFWVYAVDDNGICQPSHVDSVIYKGNQDVIEIELDDGSLIKSTNNHKWMLSDCTWKETSELCVGDSLMSIYDSINYLGYEQIKSSVEPKKRPTHRIVAESVLHDEKVELAKNNINKEKIVIHHNTFNKLDNEPNSLTYMYWCDHQKLHTDLNQKRWENEEFAEKMKKIFSETSKKTWKNKRDVLIDKLKKVHRERMSKLTQEEKNAFFGRNGEQNGMYDVHRYGSLNPNYHKNAAHVEDIDENEYIECILTSPNNNKEILKQRFNLTKQAVGDYNRYLCEKYKLKFVYELKNILLFDKIKQTIQDNPTLSSYNLASLLNLSVNTMKHVLKKNGTSVSEIKNNSLDVWNGLSEDLYVDFILSCDNKKKINSLIAEKFNISSKRVCKLNNILLKKYNIKTINFLKYVKSQNYNIITIKNILLSDNLIKESELSKKLGISNYELNNVCKINGYKNFLDLKKSLYNHRVKSIRKCLTKEPVYDLLNSSVNNCFGVKCKNGFIISHNCPISSKGTMLNVYSKSQRIKSILDDLFNNRLHVYVELPMIARHLCKYGNTYELLHIDKNEGVLGWMMLPVYEVDREENGFGLTNAPALATATNETKPDEVNFVWRGVNSETRYKNWQVAHFRLLYDSFFLPYGTSMLHKARRAWRMWSMMEDAMLIHRLDKAVERRVFKIYVGGIDDQDVPAYVNEIANRFKRTEIIDPKTGQVDLRKNFLDVSSDYFIPVRREDAPNPIETLPAANSQIQMEDLEYMQEKMLCAMRVPRTFLNFKEANGKAQNLSFTDIRFSRMINRVQQFLLLELNKIAMIHLYVLGLHDDLGNFTISLNNPTSQIESQELDDLTKRLSALQTALADPGNGIPMMSLHKGLRDIMKMSDSEIKDMLNEIRLEKAMAFELQSTPMVIKKTGMFNTVDRIYGDFEAMKNPQQMQPQGQDDGMGGMGGLGGGGGFGGDFGGDLGGGMDDMGLGEPGTEEDADITGGGETDMGGAPAADEGQPLMELKKHKTKSFTEKYFDMLSQNETSTLNEINKTSYDIELKNKSLGKNLETILETLNSSGVDTTTKIIEE